MEDNYTVDLDELQALARRLEDFTSFVRERLIATDQCATRLSTDWSGPAAEAFQQKVLDWAGSAERLILDLSAMTTSVKDACEAYSAAFDSNSSMLMQGRR